MDRRARWTPPGAASSTEECPSTVPVFRWRGRGGAGSASGRAANVAGNDGGVVLGVNCDKGRLPNPHPGDRRTYADGTRVAPPGPVVGDQPREYPWSSYRYRPRSPAPTVVRTRPSLAGDRLTPTTPGFPTFRHTPGSGSETYPGCPPTLKAGSPGQPAPMTPWRESRLWKPLSWAKTAPIYGLPRAGG